MAPLTPLAQYLAGMRRHPRGRSQAQQVEHGARCLRPADLAQLRRRLPEVRTKAERGPDSPRLKLRLELLRQFLAESAGAGVAEREVAFALAYFLEGEDLIPDAQPGIGLVDDALILEAAFRRNQHELRAHWAARGRPWPEAI